MTVRVPLVEVACPLCGAAECDTVLVAPDPTGAVEGEFRVARCRACGMKYLNPRPPDEALAACYSADYSPHRDEETGRAPRRLSHLDRLVLGQCYGWPFRTPPPGRRHDASRFVRRLLAPLCRRFEANWRNLRFFPFEGAGRVLDLGCGSGNWLALLAQGGWAGAGIEIDPVAAERARARGAFPVHTGTMLDAPFPPASFDAVNVSHVLEHVANPAEVLAAIHRLLVPGGLLVISSPVADGEAGRRLGPHWHYLELPRHLLHFDRRVLVQFIESSGFRVERLLDDPAGDGWRVSHRHAPEALHGEKWLADLARRKRLRRRVSADLARQGRSSFVVIHARRERTGP